MNQSSAFIITAFSLILVVLIIIPLSTDHWENYEEITENATDPTSVGLWRFCRRNGCVHFSEFFTSSAVRAVRAFLFLSFLSGLMATLFSGRLAFGKQDTKYFLITFSFLIVICMFLGMVIYSALDIENDFYSAGVTEDIAQTAVRFYGYSFIIGWVTFIVSILSFIFVIWVSREVKDVDSDH